MSQVALSPAVKKTAPSASVAGRIAGRGDWYWGQLQRLQRGAICPSRRRNSIAPLGRAKTVPEVVLQVHHPRFLPRPWPLGGHHRARPKPTCRGGGSSDDLPAMCPLGRGQYGVDAAARAGVGPGWAAPARMFGACPQNAIRSGAVRHNIAAHYDLSNDFFPPLSRRPT